MAHTIDEAAPANPPSAESTESLPMNGRGTEPGHATRYICAAMHLDRKLADQVLSELLEDDHHAFGTADGMDLGLVTRHAALAERYRRIRDVILVAFILVTLVGIAVVKRAPWVVVIGVVGLWATVFIAALRTRYHVLARSLRRGGVQQVPSDPPSRRLRKRLATVDSLKDGNVTVYSGFSPFVGCGEMTQYWSFVIDTSKAADTSVPVKPVSNREVRQALISAVEDLGWEDIAIEDRVFLSGTEVRNDRRFLPDPEGRPVGNISDRLMQKLIDSPEPAARHYLCMRFNAWGGELIVTTFVRFVMRRDALFVECVYLLLPPVKQTFHEVDDIATPPTIKQVLALSGGSVVRTPWLTLLSIPHVVGVTMAPIERWRRRRRELRQIREHLAFDYGTRFTPRGAASDKRYHRYFQRLDQDMYLKVVEKRILDAMVEFLSSKGIDTHDLEERQTTILNNGVMVSGGSFSADSIAVGQGAKATKQEVS